MDTKLFDALHALVVGAKDEAERICATTPCLECEGHRHANCKSALIAKDLIRNGVVLADRKPLSEFLHPINGYEGLKAKFLVFKADSGERVTDCFVLRPTNDLAAVEALRTYADTTENEVLAEDLINWVGARETLQHEAKLYWKRATANTWHLTCSAYGTHLGCDDTAKFCHECGARFVKPKAVAPVWSEEDSDGV